MLSKRKRPMTEVLATIKQLRRRLDRLEALAKIADARTGMNDPTTRRKSSAKKRR